MRKITVLTTTTLLILFVFSSLKAQNKISLITGVQSSNITASGLNTNIIDFQPINRFYAGIVYERNLDPLLSIKTGVIFKQKGFQVSESTNVSILDLPIPVGVKVITEVNTIDVPLLLQLNINNASAITPYFAVGPNLSYATSGNVRTRATAILDFGLSNSPLNLGSEDYNRLGVEGMISAGAHLAYGSGSFNADITYTRGLNDFLSESFLLDTGIRTSGIGLNVGYTLAF